MKNTAKILYRIPPLLIMVIALFYVSTSTTLLCEEFTNYNTQSPKILLSGKTVEALSCRINIKKLISLKRVKLHLNGPKGKRVGQITFWGKEGGLPIPLYTEIPLKRITLDKLKDGIEEISVEINDNFLQKNTFFIVVHDISDNTEILCDKDKVSPECVNGSTTYMTCQIKPKGKEWTLLPHMVNMSIEYERVESNKNFYIDSLILNPKNSYVGKEKFLSVNDYDNDGFNDIIANGKLYKNSNGTSLLLYRDSLVSSSVTKNAFFADLNNDGKKEVVQLGIESSKGKIYEYDGTKLVEKLEFKHPSIENISSITLGNFNGDAYIDIFIGQKFDKLSTKENLSFVILGGETWVHNIHTFNFDGKNKSVISANFVDIDSDGDTELFINLSDSLSSSRIYSIRDYNYEEESYKVLPFYEPESINSSIWAYEDEDRFLDVLLPKENMNRFTRKDNLILQSGVASNGTDNHNSFLSGYSTADRADINGDGCEDIVLSQKSLCSNLEIHYKNDKGEYVDKTLEEGFPLLNNVTEFVVADIDNSGTPDFVILLNDSLKIVKNITENNGTFTLNNKSKMSLYNSVLEIYSDKGIQRKQIMSSKGNTVILPIQSKFSCPSNIIDSVKIYENGTKKEYVFTDVKPDDILTLEDRPVEESEMAQDNLTLSVFPNPVQDNMTFRIAESRNEETRVIVEDILGNIIDVIVIEKNQKHKNWICRFKNGASLNNGVYYARIESMQGSKATVFQIVK